MIEFSKKSIILYTDHDFALSIVKQTSLVISSIDKLNLRLIRAFEYIQRFNVIIRHKSEKQHIVLDALSRLASENDDSNTSEFEKLDALHEFIKKNLDTYNSDQQMLDVLFITILVEMNLVLKKKIITEYITDSK